MVPIGFGAEKMKILLPSLVGGNGIVCGILRQISRFSTEVVYRRGSEGWITVWSHSLRIPVFGGRKRIERSVQKIGGFLATEYRVKSKTCKT